MPPTPTELTFLGHEKHIIINLIHGTGEREGPRTMERLTLPFQGATLTTNNFSFSGHLFTGGFSFRNTTSAARVNAPHTEH
jgi:hypothetical protein